MAALWYQIVFSTPTESREMFKDAVIIVILNQCCMSLISECGDANGIKEKDGSNMSNFSLSHFVNPIWIDEFTSRGICTPQVIIRRNVTYAVDKKSLHNSVPSYETIPVGSLF